MALTSGGAAALGSFLGGGVGAVAGFAFADKSKGKHKIPIAMASTLIFGTLGAFLFTGLSNTCPPCPTSTPPSGRNPLSPP